MAARSIQTLAIDALPERVWVLTPEGRLVAEAPVARATLQRTRGLIGRRIERGEGMLFPHCRSVHTWLMSRAIDIVYLDEAGAVCRVVHTLRPWRFSAARRPARHVLELTAGRAAEVGLEPGMPLRFEGAPGSRRAVAA